MSDTQIENQSRVVKQSSCGEFEPDKPEDEGKDESSSDIVNK